MSEHQNVVTVEQIRAEASEAAASERDLRLEVKDITLRALRDRSFDLKEIKSVLRAVTEGVSEGLERRDGDIRGSVREAFKGLDDAMSGTAEAFSLALREMAAKGKDFSDGELKTAFDNLRRLEKDFLSTVSQVAHSGGDLARQELNDAVTHARRAGTDTGARVSDTLENFRNRMKFALGELSATSKQAAQELGARVASVGAGMLEGFAERLREKSEKKRD